MIRHGIPYVWAWPNHPSLLVESDFVVLIKGLNGYLHRGNRYNNVYMLCSHIYNMSENDEILSIAEEIKELLITGASADDVNNKIEELRRYIE